MLAVHSNSNEPCAFFSLLVHILHLTDHTHCLNSTIHKHHTNLPPERSNKGPGKRASLMGFSQLLMQQTVFDKLQPGRSCRQRIPTESQRTSPHRHNRHPQLRVHAYTHCTFCGCCLTDTNAQEPQASQHPMLLAPQTLTRTLQARTRSAGRATHSQPSYTTLHSNTKADSCPNTGQNTRPSKECMRPRRVLRH